MHSVYLITHISLLAFVSLMITMRPDWLLVAFPWTAHTLAAHQQKTEACERISAIESLQPVRFRPDVPFKLATDEQFHGRIVVQSLIRVTSWAQEQVRLSVSLQATEKQLEDAVSLTIEENEATVVVDGRGLDLIQPSCINIEILLQLPQYTQGLTIASETADVLFDATNCFVKQLDVLLDQGTLAFQHARGLHAGEVTASLKQGHIHLTDTELTSPKVAMTTASGAIVLQGSEIFGHETTLETQQGSIIAKLGGSPDAKVSLRTITGSIDVGVWAVDPGFSHKEHLASISANSQAGNILLDVEIPTPIQLDAVSKNGALQVLISGNEGGHYTLQSKHGSVSVIGPNALTWVQRVVNGMYGNGKSAIKMSSTMGSVLLRIEGEREPIQPPPEKHNTDEMPSWFLLTMPLMIAAVLGIIAGVATARAALLEDIDRSMRCSSHERRASNSNNAG
ncbi:hypothetical protein BCR37DRAFT_394593 [Protomyces lactucae-debilis]|uniref:DUF7330 domain-containing protein n=1 Tax=Protomyces lactucae-debilis TaxID=2754530 RepID=A0A1Y2F420_PROLT|nr:uncharacterized protein BCR37DRAFT_394593 [Protomyces lactucae-debilis]ORY78658.1 hypothetical protein BCR37DRAFT_394593 [Protomyces lactucae-debilis]